MISGLGRNGNPLQYSCQEKPMDRGAWQAMVHGVAESDTTEAIEQYFLSTVLNILCINTFILDNNLMRYESLLLYSQFTNEQTEDKSY